MPVSSLLQYNVFVSQHLCKCVCILYATLHFHLTQGLCSGPAWTHGRTNGDEEWMSRWGRWCSALPVVSSEHCPCFCEYATIRVRNKAVSIYLLRFWKRRAMSSCHFAKKTTEPFITTTGFSVILAMVCLCRMQVLMGLACPGWDSCFQCWGTGSLLGMACALCCLCSQLCWKLC